MIFSAEYPQGVHRNITRTEKFRIVDRYKPNIQKSTVSLYTKNNWKLKFRNTIHNSIKNMKHLGINLTKYIQDLYVENNKL